MRVAPYLSGKSWPFHGLRGRDIHGLPLWEVVPGPGLFAGGSTSLAVALFCFSCSGRTWLAMLNRGRQGTAINGLGRGAALVSVPARPRVKKNKEN